MLEKLNKFPPLLCRAVARVGRGRASRPMTNKEIATAAGISVRSVIRISQFKHWDGLTLAAIDAFSRACGVNLLNTRRQVDFMKRKKHSHWLKNPKFYQRLLQNARDIKRVVATGSTPKAKSSSVSE